MKLQYLGDSRDSFKWDLLHHLVRTSDFDRLYFVPFLTPDDPERTDGNTPPDWFPCRQEILDFNARLRQARDLKIIGELGSIDGEKRFAVQMFHSERHVEPGPERRKYLDGFEPTTLDRTLVFFDPDNGFETDVQKSVKWVRHSEIQDSLIQLPESSAIAVYQHRPRFQSWDDSLPRILSRCDYAPFGFAIYEANLAFVMLSKSKEIHERLTGTAQSYIQNRVPHLVRVWPEG